MEKINSQICTTREQSERLLALGLKKETADMTWNFSYMMKGEPQYDLLAESTWDEDTIQRYVEHGVKMTLFDHWKHSDGTQMTPLEIYAEITKKDIPAWSLHRLLELSPELVKQETTYFTKDGNVELVNGDGIVTKAWGGKSLYDALIDFFQWLIKEGYFNKEYLNENIH